MATARYVRDKEEFCILCNKENKGENLRKIRVEHYRIITMCLSCAMRMQEKVNLIGLTNLQY